AFFWRSSCAWLGTAALRNRACLDVLHLCRNVEAVRCAAVLFRPASGEHDIVCIHNAALDDHHAGPRLRGMAWEILSSGRATARPGLAGRPPAHTFIILSLGAVGRRACVPRACEESAFNTSASSIFVILRHFKGHFRRLPLFSRLVPSFRLPVLPRAAVSLLLLVAIFRIGRIAGSF